MPPDESVQERNPSQVRMKHSQAPLSSIGTDNNKKISKESMKSLNSKVESLNFSMRRDHLNPNSGSGES
jgi:DNA-binding transcriptional regulator WhiA